MSNDNVVSLRQPEPFQDALTQLLREQAQTLIQRAVMDEFARFLDAERGTLGDGRSDLVRNGFQPQREVLTGLGSVPVKVPKARDRAGRGRVFRSELVPPYVRKAASVEAVLPWAVPVRHFGRPVLTSTSGDDHA
jgi:transposase-like protein